MPDLPTTINELGVWDRSWVVNGRFEHHVNGWYGAPVYLASDGFKQPGCAKLALNQLMWQQFAVPITSLATIHYAFKFTGTGNDLTVTLFDGWGNSVQVWTPASLTTWQEIPVTIGMAMGGWYKLQFQHTGGNAGDLLIDDVWVWQVLETRADMATRIMAKLGRLASNRSWSITPVGTLTEGDLTFPIDDALRDVGAVDIFTRTPDVRWLDKEDVPRALQTVERLAMEKLRNDYLVETDLSVGGRSERFSQVAAGLEDTLKHQPSRIVTRKFRYPDLQ